MNFKISSKRLGTHSLGSFIHQGDSRNKIQAKFTLSFTTGAGRGKHKRTLHREIKGNPTKTTNLLFIFIFSEISWDFGSKWLEAVHSSMYTIKNISTTKCFDVYHRVRLLTCMFSKLLKEFISVPVFRNVSNKQAVVVKRNSHTQLFPFPQLKII